MLQKITEFGTNVHEAHKKLAVGVNEETGKLAQRHNATGIFGAHEKVSNFVLDAGDHVAANHTVAATAIDTVDPVQRAHHRKADGYDPALVHNFGAHPLPPLPGNPSVEKPVAAAHSAAPAPVPHPLPHPVHVAPSSIHVVEFDASSSGPSRPVAAAPGIPIEQFLSELGLLEYVAIFRDNGFDVDVLRDLLEGDELERELTAIGVKRGHLLKIRNALRRN